MNNDRAFVPKQLVNKWKTRLLGLLILADIIFIIGHGAVVFFFESEPNNFLLDAQGFGYPELFQYVKYIVIQLFLGNLLIVKKKYTLIPFLPLFFVLLIDDMYQLHSKAGWLVVHLLNLKSVMGIKALIFGQLTFISLAGIVFLSFSFLFYRKSSESIKRIFVDIFMLLAVFLFFGIAIDIVNQQFEQVYVVSSVLTVIEEGGEMIALSLLVWYFCFLVLESNQKNQLLQPFLFRDCKVNIF